MIILSIVALAITVIGYLLYRGAQSPLRPTQIPETAWGISIRCCLTHRRIIFLLALLLLCGEALQIYFFSFPGYSKQFLIIFSLCWKAVSASILALLVVPIHLFTIHVVLGPRLYWGGPLQYRSVPKTIKFRPIFLKTALFGFGIWLISTALLFARNSLQAIAEGHFRFVSYSLIVVSFLIMTPLSLVRPAVSLELARPFRTGISVAFRNLLALNLMSALLLIPVVIMFILVNILLPGLLTSEDQQAVWIVTNVIFTTFQTLAVEASTVIFMKRALSLPDERNVALASTMATTVLPKSGD